MTILASRRDFLRGSAALVGGLIVTSNGGIYRALGGPVTLEDVHNWATNVDYGTPRIEKPASVRDICRIIAEPGPCHAIGGRHSFSKIAACKGGKLIDMSGFNRLLDVDSNGVAIVQPGITHGKLGYELAKRDLAIVNHPSTPHITIEGAASTATHGSGTGNQASMIRFVTFINGRREKVTLHRGQPGFNAAAVGLGSYGVVIELGLDTVPAFDVRQEVYSRMPIETFIDNIDAIEAEGYSVSGFTDWEEVDVWVKMRAGDAPYTPKMELFGAKRAAKNQHPVRALDAENCTPQMGERGPSYDRLAHFLLSAQPSSKGNELHAEFFVPWVHAPAAIRAVMGIRTTVQPVLIISELRTIKCDDLLVSTANGSAGSSKMLAMHFTLKMDREHGTMQQDIANVMQMLPVLEAALKQFGARPHWGKLFTMKAAYLQSLYPQFGLFREFARKHDPCGKFHNAFNCEYVFGHAA